MSGEVDLRLVQLIKTQKGIGRGTVHQIYEFIIERLLAETAIHGTQK